MHCAGDKFCKGHVHTDGCEGWVRLKKGNDWGFDYWAIEPIDYSMWKHTGAADHRRGINFEWPMEFPVILPDGRRATARASVSLRPVEVSDMGHSYSGATQRIRFLVDNDRAYKPGEVLVSREWAENAPRMM